MPDLISLRWPNCMLLLTAGIGLCAFMWWPGIKAAEEDQKALALLDGEPGKGRWVGLTLTLTKDADDPLHDFQWRQTKGPKPDHVIDVPDQARLWILTWETGEYVFELSAKSKSDTLVSATLQLFVEAGREAADRETAMTDAGAGECVTLQGEGWKQIGGPRIRLRSNQDGLDVSFRPAKSGLYLFESMGTGFIPERRAIRVPPGKDGLMGNRRPIAKLPTSMDGVVDRPVVVDGTLSSDPDHPERPLDALWTGDFEKGGLKLQSKADLKATFVASRKGVFRIQLRVSDGSLESAPVEAFLRIRDEDEMGEGAQGEDPGGPPDPLAHEATLFLYESNLDRAVQAYPSHCEVALRIATVVGRPELYSRMPLDLGFTNTPVRIVSDWIARQTDLAWHSESERSLWLTRPGAWWSEEKADNIMLSVDALYEEDDASDLLSLLKEAFRGVLAHSPGASISIDVHTQNVLAVMPKPACLRLKTLIANLRAPEGLGFPAWPVPTGRALALRRMLATRKIDADWQGRRFDLLLRDLARYSGFATGCDPRQFEGELPRITLQLKDVPLRQAVRDIVEQAGLDGCQAQQGKGLWFFRGEEPYPSGELLWDIAYVRTYPLKPVLERVPLLTGEIVAHHIRRRVFPGSWKDPAATCAYHEATGKLVLIHGPEAHEGAARCLHDFLARGMDALGPAMSGEE